MLAIVKRYLKITADTTNTQLKLAIDMAIDMASMYINKPLIIEEQYQDYGKVKSEDDLYLINYPIYSIDQLRVSTSFKFDTSGEYDTPTVLFIDSLKGMVKLDTVYSGDFRARYKSGYNYKVFNGKTVTIDGDIITLEGLYNIDDIVTYFNANMDARITCSYSENTNKFSFTEGLTQPFTIVFEDDLTAKLFGFNNSTQSLSSSHISDIEVFWLPENIKSAINIITDKIHNISKMLSGNVEFRKKKIVHQDGLQTEFNIDDIPIEAKLLLDPYKRVYL